MKDLGVEVEVVKVEAVVEVEVAIRVEDTVEVEVVNRVEDSAEVAGMEVVEVEEEETVAAGVAEEGVRK